MTTISCEEAAAAMRRALGDEPVEPTAELSAHLAECGSCAEAWETQQSVRSLLAGREPAPVPAGFSARLETELDALTPWWAQFDWRWWTLRVAPLTAALLLVVGGASLATSSGSSSTSSSATVSTTLLDTGSTVSSDTLLLAVLSGSPDDTVDRFEGSAR